MQIQAGDLQEYHNKKGDYLDSITFFVSLHNIAQKMIYNSIIKEAQKGGSFFMAREFAKSFYNSKEWKTTREYVLKRDNYLCCLCGKPAEEVHHKKHISESNVSDANVTMNANNLISLCRECHFNQHKGEHANGRKKREEDVQIFDSNGYLIDTPQVK